MEVLEVDDFIGNILEVVVTEVKSPKDLSISIETLFCCSTINTRFLQVEYYNPIPQGVQVVEVVR